jgi:hypothetical protein
VLLTLNLPLLLSDNLMTPSSVNSLSSTAFQLLSFVSQAGVKTVGSLRPSQISRGELQAITVETIRLDRYTEQKHLALLGLW